MAKFREMVAGQGGDIAMIDNHTDPSWHPAASVVPVFATEAGVVKSIDALSAHPATFICISPVSLVLGVLLVLPYRAACVSPYTSCLTLVLVSSGLRRAWQVLAR